MLNDGGQRKFTVAKRGKNGITGGYTYNPYESFLIEEKIRENEWVEQNYFSAKKYLKFPYQKWFNDMSVAPKVKKSFGAKIQMVIWLCKRALHAVNVKE